MLSWIGGTFVFVVSLWIMISDLQWHPLVSVIAAVALTIMVVGLLQPYEEN